jgi:FtsP/CotA-like multicopper oxidase with cupredoxin domain
MTITRRDFLLLGGGAALGAGALALAHRAPARLPTLKAQATGPLAADRYGHGAMPPMDAGPLALDHATRLPPASPATKPRAVDVALEAVDQSVSIAADRTFDAWTFNGGVPGPILRANEGDALAIRFSNRTTHPHNLHFHGRHAIDADGWEPVPPGGETTYRITAGPFGLHPYHCDMTPADDHITNGLYGLLVVDPPGGRPPAHEFAMVLCGFDVNADGQSDLFAWNGLAGFFAKYPLKVPAGDRVRLYLLNMVMDQPMASFHLHAETFDVFRSGTRLTPDERTDLVTLGPAERVILEFTLPNRGRYMFHPHQRVMAEHGAMGWIAAV